MKRVIPAALLLLLLTACAEPAETADVPSPDEALYAQALLFLQQGLRQHDVTDAFQVYFAPPEEGTLEILLEGGGAFWWEEIAWSYDGERDWYAFSGSFEPVLTRDPFVRWDPEDEECLEFRSAAAYQTGLSADTDMAVPLRFDIPAGPVVCQQRIEEPSYLGGLETWLYDYQDQRLDFTARFTYPQYSVYTSGLADPEAVNQRIWDAFAYGYYDDADRGWNPAELCYGEISRSGTVTRADRRYFSVRIYEYNSFRGANHPNWWETGVTIDLETGLSLTLRDIIGPDRTVEDLIDTGAFRCLAVWEGSSPEARAAAEAWQIQSAKETVDPETGDGFYLTEDSLGLFCSPDRYYYCMEAPFSALGLEALAAEE